MLDECDVKRLRELDPNNPGMTVTGIGNWISALDECLNVLNELIKVYESAASSLSHNQMVAIKFEYAQFNSPTCRGIIRVVFGKDDLPKLDDPMSVYAALATLQAEIAFLRETKRGLEERYYEHRRFVAATLAEHKLLAGILKDAKETKDLIEVIDDVSKLNGKSKHFECVDNRIVQRSTMKPYVHLISSVGTGKTQMAFTLANCVPLIYILDSDTSDDEFMIGEHFKESCGKFLALFEKDMSKANLSVERMFERKMKCECLGFLVSLWKEMIRVKDESMSWIEVQVSDRLRHIWSDPLDFNECASKLKQLFENNRAKLGGYQPIFIYDQLEYPETEGVPGHEMLKLLRLTGLVTVVMGGGIDPHWNKQEKRFSKLDSRPFCVLTTKLPGYPPQVFTEKFERIREILSNRLDLSTSDRQRISDLVDMTEKAIVVERPGLINCIIGGLKLLAEGKAHETAQSPESLLQWITHHLYVQVCSKLNDTKEHLFAEGQSSYSGFRGRYFNGWRVSHLSFPCKPIRYCDDYLDYYQDRRKMTAAYKQDQTPNTRFTAALQNEMDDYRFDFTMVVERTGCEDWTRMHVWGRFAEEPFTSLAFCTSPWTGPFSRNLALPNKCWMARIGRLVKYPEELGPAALVHTLSAGGFRGQTVSEWLQKFFIQLNIFGSHKLEWESVELKDALSKIRLPFCGPVDEPWNEHVLDYIRGKCKGFLGIITQSSSKKLGELLTVQVMPPTTTDMKGAKIQCLCKDVILDSDTVRPAVRKLISAESELDVFLCSPRRYHNDKNIEAIKESLKSVAGIKRVAILYVARGQRPPLRTFITIRLLYGDLAAAERFLILLHCG